MSRHDLDSSWPCSLYGPCPCGSGAKAKFCCRKGKNRWVTKPRWQPTVHAISGVRNASCFAAGFGACSEKISSEHYISHSVLKLFGELVSIAGLVMSPPGESKTIPTGRLTANVLCKTHNEMLAPLDEVAKSLFTSARDFIVSFATQASEGGRLLLMNGNDIEHLMLKMLCGLTASGAVRGLGAKQIEPRWGQILFGNSEWPHGWGMYVQQTSAGTYTDDLKHLSVGINLNSQQLPRQLGIRFASWHLLLHVGDELLPTSQFRFRPDLLVSQRGSRKFGIALTYKKGDTGGGFVRQTIHDTQWDGSNSEEQ